MKTRTGFAGYFYYFLLTAFPVPVRLKVTLQKLVMVKISNIFMYI